MFHLTIPYILAWFVAILLSHRHVRIGSQGLVMDHGRQVGMCATRFQIATRGD